MPVSKNPMVTAILPNERAVGFRFANGDDQAYVSRTWVASVIDADLGPHASAAGLRHYEHPVSRERNDTVDRLLDEQTTHVLVACEPNDPRRILGWIAYSTSGVVRVLQYINVRTSDRRQGIADELVRRAGLAPGAAPMVYLFEGPSASWAKTKRPDAIHMTPKEYLQV